MRESKRIMVSVRRLAAATSLVGGSLVVLLTGCGGEEKPAAGRFTPTDGSSAAVKGSDTGAAGSPGSGSMAGATTPSNAMGGAAGTGNPVRPPAVSAATLDTPKVPANGTPAELTEFLADAASRQAKLMQMAPQMQQPMLQAQVLALQAVRFEAASKLLEHPDATPTQRRPAMDTAMQALSTAGNFTGPGSELVDQIGPFLDKYSADSDPRVSQFAQLMQINIMAEQIAIVDESDGPSEPGPAVDAFFQKINDWLANHPHDAQTFQILMLSGQQLVAGARFDEGLQVFKLLEDVYRSAPDMEMPDTKPEELTVEQQEAITKTQLKGVLQTQIDAARLQQVLVESGLEDAVTKASQGDAAAADQVVRIFSDALRRDDLAAFPLLAVGNNMVSLLESQASVDQAKTLAQRMLERIPSIPSDAPAEMKEQHATLVATADRLAEVSALRSAMVDVNIEALINDLYAKKPGAGDAVLKAVDAMLDRTDVPSRPLIGALIQLSSEQLEPYGFNNVAGGIYQRMAARFNQPDEANGLTADMVKEIDQFAKDGLSRIGLVGKPFDVEGMTIDGKPFDWSKYRGKVVLVDFWATWCVPCLEEVPNIRANYEKYHDQGFEVIGVNVDDEPETAAAFLKARPMPWTTVVSPDPAAPGMESPFVKKVGIQGIPFVVLVGRDGNVVGIHVRGSQLGVQLAELFPDGGAAPK